MRGGHLHNLLVERLAACARSAGLGVDTEVICVEFGDLLAEVKPVHGNKPEGA